MKRVVVTGIGMVSPGGLDAASSWIAVRDAHDLLQLATDSIGHSLGTLQLATLQGFDAGARFDRRVLGCLDPVAQYGIAAAREAVAQAGIDIASVDEARTRCIVGTGAGGEYTHDRASRQVYCDGAVKLHPMTVPRIMVSAVASQIALDLGIRGGVYVVSSACASAAHAIGQAFTDIRSGAADIAITGGSEACLTFGCIRAWQALHVLSDDRCRPFSKGRRGLVLSEGSAMFVLEERDMAIRRGADVLAEIVGFGMSSDAASLTAPDAGGMKRAMVAAIADASLPVDAVDHVNAHGTGTFANDVAECLALAAVFGNRSTQMPVTATKAVLGHSLGASAAVELAVAVMTLRHQVIPPTANFVEADPQCPIDCVPFAARDAAIETILSNSFAFGGLNASLLVRRG